MKLYVTIIEIDSAVYAEVDLAENKTPAEIRAWHVAQYMASGLWDESAPECSIATVEPQTASVWEGDDVRICSAVRCRAYLEEVKEKEASENDNV